MLALTKKLSEVWKQLLNPRFNLLPDKIEMVDNLVNNYPESPNDIQQWSEKYNAIYEDYKAKIAIKK